MQQLLNMSWQDACMLSRWAPSYIDKVGGGGSLKRSISCFLFKRSQEKMKDSPNNY
jgi:hypothetical protein